MRPLRTDAGTTPIENLLTVDVEDWFHILEYDGAPAPQNWDALESRVEANVHALLELFEARGVHATFFVLGWIARRHPALVTAIAGAGHEVASHSDGHEVLTRMTPAQFAEDLRRSRASLEDAAGTRVAGFRAPGTSLTASTLWAIDTLIDQEFEYDSSLCPGRASHGGISGTYEGPYRILRHGSTILEFPISTFSLGPRRVPYMAGGYLRLLPLWLVRRAIRRDNRRGRPANGYIHPREIDPVQPRLRLTPWRRYKYYVGLEGADRKLRALLSSFPFVSIAEWRDHHPDSASLPRHEM